jgi:hypothetical protein
MVGARKSATRRVLEAPIITSVILSDRPLHSGLRDDRVSFSLSFTDTNDGIQELGLAADCF